MVSTDQKKKQLAYEARLKKEFEGVKIMHYTNIEVDGTYITIVYILSSGIMPTVVLPFAMYSDNYYDYAVSKIKLHLISIAMHRPVIEFGHYMKWLKEKVLDDKTTYKKRDKYITKFGEYPERHILRLWDHLDLPLSEQSKGCINLVYYMTNTIWWRKS